VRLPDVEQKRSHRFVALLFAITRVGQPLITARAS
jgi:hypothetical protein